MNTRNKTIAAMICAVLLSGGTVAAVTGCQSSGSGSSTEVTEVQQQPATAAQICSQLHGTNFVSKDIGDAKILWGMTSGGTFWLDGKKYAVNTFSSKEARDDWLKYATRFGVVPKWMSDTAVVYPSVWPH